jgi:hypothetical protein
MNPKIIANSIKIGVFASLLTPLIVNFDFYFPFVGPKSLYFMAVSEVMFFLWVVLAWHWKHYRLDIKNPLIAAVLVFAGASFVSAVFGADFSASFWSKFERMGGVLMLLHLAAFTVATAAVFENRDWKRLFYASIGVAVYVSTGAMFGVNNVARGGGSLGNDSFFGTYLLFNAFIAFYLLLVRNKPGDQAISQDYRAHQKKTETRDREMLRRDFFSFNISWENVFFVSKKWREHIWPRLFAAAALLAMSFCLVFESTQFWNKFLLDQPYSYAGGLFIDIIQNGARAAKLSFFAGIALFGLLRLAVHKNTAIRKSIFILIGLAAAGSLFAAVSLFEGGKPIREVVISKLESVVGNRVVVWQIAWDGFLNRPFLGWGPENFNLAFARHYNPCLGTIECGMDVWYDRAHNIVLDTLVEIGIVGFIGYLAIFAAAIYLLWRAYLLKIADFAAAGMFTALLAAYFLQNMVVFDMVTSYLMFFVCLAFISSFYKPRLSDEKVWPLPLKPHYVAIVLAIAAVCFNFFVISPAVASRGATGSMLGKYGSSEKLDTYRSALEASPMGKYQIRIFFAHQWLTAMQNKNITARMTHDQAQKTYAFLADELEKSSRESPLDYQSRLELGRIYGGWGLLDKSKLPLAEKVLKDAINISPNNQQAYWELAQNYLYQIKISDAKAAATQAYDLYPGSKKSKTVLEEIDRIEKTQTAGNK